MQQTTNSEMVIITDLSETRYIHYDPKQKIYVLQPSLNGAAGFQRGNAERFLLRSRDPKNNYPTLKVTEIPTIPALVKTNKTEAEVYEKHVRPRLNDE